MTAQVHEGLIYEGTETSMAFCPPLPVEHPRIIALTAEQARNEELSPFIFSTACWRNYIGKWEIRDGQLYLISINGIFKMVGEEPIPADWFSGVIRVPRGDLLHYVHMGFGSVYEEELHIKIEQGKVIQTVMLDNRGKDVDTLALRRDNLPGFENHFDGEDEG